MRVLVLLLLATSAFATDEQLVLNQVIPCNDWEFIQYNLTKEYSELPFTQRETTITLTNKKELSGTSITFVNPDTRTYTTVIKFEELACILEAGQHFKAADLPTGI